MKILIVIILSILLFGCVFRYGELPEKGFPDWCPLIKEGKNGK